MRFLVPALLVMVVPSCGDVATTVVERPRPLVTCIPPMDIAIDVAGGPRFTWRPACGATYLEVSSPDNLVTSWIVQGDTGKIGPGVVYGVDPPTYESRFGPLPLESGQWYVVRVGVMVDDNSYALVGERRFQR
jgi:hypothetical protein